MNILLLTRIYPEPDDKDGYKPTRTVEYFAKEWVKAGHKVLVIHCQAKFPLIYYLIPEKIVNCALKNSYALIPAISSRKELNREEHGIKICRIPMKKIIPSTAFSQNEMKQQIRRIIATCKKDNYFPDIVMGHFANPCFELTAKVASAFKVKSSFVFHNDCSRRNIDKYNLSEYVNAIDIIGGRSVIETKYIKEALGLHYEPFVCYSGVPNDIVEEAERICTKHSERIQNIEFLFVGGLIANKHVDTVINAFSRIFKEGYHLTVVGGGPEEDYLHELVKKNRIEQAVTFSGRIPREQVAKKMKEANIFVMVSESETFGMVYLEAMLQGCIVIASTGGGFDGIVKNGENGFLSEAGDINQLIQTFKTIMELSRNRWNQVGQAAIDTALKYSEKTVAEQYLQTVTQG